MGLGYTLAKDSLYGDRGWEPSSFSACVDFTLPCQLSELISNKTMYFILIQSGLSIEAFPYITVKYSGLTHDWHKKEKFQF